MQFSRVPLPGSTEVALPRWPVHARNTSADAEIRASQSPDSQDTHQQFTDIDSIPDAQGELQMQRAAAACWRASIAVAEQWRGVGSELAAAKSSIVESGKDGTVAPCTLAHPLAGHLDTRKHHTHMHTCTGFGCAHRHVKLMQALPQACDMANYSPFIFPDYPCLLLSRLTDAIDLIFLLSYYQYSALTPSILVLALTLDPSLPFSGRKIYPQFGWVEERTITGGSVFVHAETNRSTTPRREGAQGCVTMCMQRCVVRRALRRSSSRRT